MAYGWIFMKPYDTKNKAMARLLGEGGNLVENTGHRFIVVCVYGVCVCVCV